MRRVLLAGLVLMLLYSLAGARVEALPLVQNIAAARGGEALDVIYRMSQLFWPTLKDQDLAILILQPGEWSVLVNHPSPPEGFVVRGTIPREGHESPTYEIPDDLPRVWSVHAGRGVAPEGWLPGMSHVLSGRRTAVVLWNHVSLPRGTTAGWPPAEAVLCNMIRELWLAHLDAREGSPRIDPMSWSYRADAEDLARGIVEQRLIARLLRLPYNERTLTRYREILSMWLAVRQTRMAANPSGVRMEEEIERRDGLAHFTQTVTFRVLDQLGQEERPHLESLDPFFDQYTGYFAIRVNALNYPLLWYPTTPIQALQRARFTGAALAFVAWPALVRWNERFFGDDPATRKTLRDVITEALGEEAPADTASRADLLRMGMDLEGGDQIQVVVRELLAAEKARGQQVYDRWVDGTDPVLRLLIACDDLTDFHSPLDRHRWLGPGLVLAEGPTRLAFRGGHLFLGEHQMVLERLGDDPDSLGALIRLPPDAVLTLDGSPIRPGAPSTGGPGRLALASPGLSLEVERASASVQGNRITVTITQPELSASR